MVNLPNSGNQNRKQSGVKNVNLRKGANNNHGQASANNIAGPSNYRGHSQSTGRQGSRVRVRIPKRNQGSNANQSKDSREADD